MGYKKIALIPTSLLPFSISFKISFKIGYKKDSVFPEPVPVVIIAPLLDSTLRIASSWCAYSGLFKFISPNWENNGETIPSSISPLIDFPLLKGKFKST